jgi:hypothetical protein
MRVNELVLLHVRRMLRGHETRAYYTRCCKFRHPNIKESSNKLELKVEEYGDSRLSCWMCGSCRRNPYNGQRERPWKANANQRKTAHDINNHKGSSDHVFSFCSAIVTLE